MNTHNKEISIFSEDILKEFETFLYDHLGELGRETIRDMRESLFFKNQTSYRDLVCLHIGEAVQMAKVHDNII